MYKVHVEEKALKYLKQLEKKQRDKIFSAIKKLQKLSSKTRNVKNLRGYKGGYRLRVGDYRVLFVRDEKKKSIKVYTIGHRKNVYRK